jgi:hypothetical protein
MRFAQLFPIVDSPIRRFILHDTGQTGAERFCVTLDFANLSDANKVHGAVFQNNQHYGNWDESKGKGYHTELHEDMQKAMGVVNDEASTLTDFHQHWVRQVTKWNGNEDETTLELFNEDAVQLLLTQLSTGNNKKFFPKSSVRYFVWWMNPERLCKSCGGPH